ncbi:hypothetical protein ACFXG4_03215 [Nocardia sp. NPDC059246]|uniref:hypothetical protein n=1 Tax=unclassified Nocardia TaxID=2637762 RepID=UPI0036C26DFF
MGALSLSDTLALHRLRDCERVLVNPLMSMVWGFDLDAVAERVLYRDDIAHATTPFEVAAAIEAFRDRTPLRPRRTIPV